MAFQNAIVNFILLRTQPGVYTYRYFLMMVDILYPYAYIPINFDMCDDDYIINNNNSH